MVDLGKAAKLEARHPLSPLIRGRRAEGGGGAEWQMVTKGSREREVGERCRGLGRVWRRTMVPYSRRCLASKLYRL